MLLERSVPTEDLSGVYEIRASHVDLHHRRQWKSQLHSTRLNGIIYVTDDVRNSLQRLRKSYKAIYGQRLWNDATMITDIITCVIGLSTGRVQDSGAAITDHVAPPNGKYNNPETSKVDSRYDSRLLLSIITIRT